MIVQPYLDSVVVEYTTHYIHRWTRPEKDHTSMYFLTITWLDFSALKPNIILTFIQPNPIFMIVGNRKTTLIILAEIQYEPVSDKHVGKKEWKENVVPKK